MLCDSPITINGIVVGCKQCINCRVNRGREWASRIMREAECHGQSAFVTLTYDDAHLPEDGSLNPEHMTNFFKRLRKNYGPVRYFYSGEYGEQTLRPHYHAAIFGYQGCLCFKSPSIGSSAQGYVKRCPHCKLLNSTWGNGIVASGILGRDSARYISGYLTKGVYDRRDPRLEGKFPQFCRMSRMPALGSKFVEGYAVALRNSNYVALEDDVPSSFLAGGKSEPLGRTLTRKLRIAAGVTTDGKAPQETMDKIQAQLLDVRAAASRDPENPSVAYHMKEANKQRRLTAEWYRRNIKRKRDL